MMLHSGELPLRGAARSKEEAASWGSSTAVLRGAAGMGREEAAFGGSSRCAGLLDCGREEQAAFGGARAARSCSIEGEKRLLRLGELPLRGAAGMGEGGG